MTPERILTFAFSLGVAFLIVTTVYDRLVAPIYATVNSAVVHNQESNQ